MGQFSMDRGHFLGSLTNYLANIIIIFTSLGNVKKDKLLIARYSCLNSALPREKRGDAIKVLKRRIKSYRSDNCEISLSASSMLITGPSQVSWILGVTRGDTDADTRKCVG
jgi:hypothetical protein